MVPFNFSEPFFLVLRSLLQLRGAGGKTGSLIEDNLDTRNVLLDSARPYPHNHPSENKDKATSAKEGP